MFSTSLRLHCSGVTCGALQTGQVCGCCLFSPAVSIEDVRSGMMCVLGYKITSTGDCLSAGELTMVLDFGSFVLDSDASAAADLPAEEAALYMGFKLSARNISAILVDGAFGWALLDNIETKSKQPGKPTPCACLSCQSARDAQDLV